MKHSTYSAPNACAICARSAELQRSVFSRADKFCGDILSARAKSVNDNPATVAAAFILVEKSTVSPPDPLNFK
nr:MAG TPA: hypothetical protein [Caudoviricetes sp.]